MKNLKNKIFVLLTTVLLLSLSSINVFAANSVLAEQKKTQVIPLTKTSHYETMKLDKGGKIVKNTLKSSKPSVLKVSTQKDSDNITLLCFSPKKTGKSVVSFKYKYKGVTKSYKFTFKVVKYTAPFKKLKIGTRNYAPEFKTNVVRYSSSKKITGKITLVPNSKWKLVGVYVGDTVKGNTAYYNYYKSVPTKSISIPKGGFILFQMYNTKYKYTENFEIDRR